MSNTTITTPPTKPQSKFLQVAKWAKYQQCDRNAPWIKVFTNLIQNYDFLKLRDSEKAALFCIWLYAGAHGNKIPNDPVFIERIFYLEDSGEKLNLDALCVAGFLEPFNQGDYDKYIENSELRSAQRKEKDRIRKHSESEKRKIHSGSETEKRKFQKLETETETETETGINTPPNPPRGKAADAAETDFPPELNTDNFKMAWEDWVQHRKEIKHTLKPTTIKGQLKKLAAAGEQTAIAMIRRSIENGWQGLFDLDSPKTTTSAPYRNDKWAAKVAESAAYCPAAEPQNPSLDELPF